ncbi:hypothetical protein KY284_032564 [Solanum tuberosum]|nr:hypothetical protein KY284_032564 [Solanum tuberosum]
MGGSHLHVRCMAHIVNLIVQDDYADRDIELVHHLKYADKVDGNPTGILLSSDWESVKRIAKFLEKFLMLILKISGSRYAT